MTSIANQHADIDRSLTNQPPDGPDIVEAFEELRSYFKNAGHAIVTFCPQGRYRALAITALEEATMWAIKAIALDQHGARQYWERLVTAHETGLSEIVADAQAVPGSGGGPNAVLVDNRSGNDQSPA